LKEHGIQWHWAQLSGNPVEQFVTNIMLSPVNDMRQQHSNCPADRYCHVLLDGYAYPCGRPIPAGIIEKHFNVKFEGMEERLNKMRLNLHNTTLNGWEIAEFLAGPTPMCEYCCFERMRTAEWAQCPRNSARLEDFVLT
jgi:hypothetical protein